MVAGRVLITRLFCVFFVLAALVAAQSASPQKNLPTIVKATNGTIVSIIMSDKDGHAVAQGTGFLISKDGRILTNYHVIKSGVSAIVKLPDGAFYDVEGVLAFDKSRDAAVIKARGQNFRTVTLGDSDRIQVGEAVVAIGSPLALESTVSNGIVSGIRDMEEEGGKFLQVTAPISPGSSGGPLFNMAGEVVGITTLYLKGGENLNFAIPINDAKRLLSAESKVQGFPNETDAANQQPTGVPLPPGATVDPLPASGGADYSSGVLSARYYYKQLYDAGGFAELFAEDEGNPYAKHYVCFNDDDNSGEFFVFTAMRFDQDFSDAAVALETIAKQYKDKGLTHGEAMQDPKVVRVLQTMDKIQKTAPYVHFSLGDWAEWNSSPPIHPWFRLGTLSADMYKKGVKEGFAAWGWDENSDSWVDYSPRTTNANVTEDRTYRLFIEPTTLRYRQTLTIVFTAGEGETKVSDSKSSEVAGICEEITPANQKQ